jgi:hypothetical protein
MMCGGRAAAISTRIKPVAAERHRRHMSLDEGLLGQQLFQVAAHRLAPPGICFQGVAAIVAKRREILRRRCPGSFGRSFPRKREARAGDMRVALDPACAR